jgi:hypothetical protein
MQRVQHPIQPQIVARKKAVLSAGFGEHFTAQAEGASVRWNGGDLATRSLSKGDTPI